MKPPCATGQLGSSLASVSPPKGQRWGHLGFLPTQLLWAPWPWGPGSDQWRTRVGPGQTLQKFSLALSCSQKKREENKGGNQTMASGLPPPQDVFLRSPGWGGRVLGGDVVGPAPLMLGPAHAIQTATTWTFSCPGLTTPGAVGVLDALPQTPDDTPSRGHGDRNREKEALSIIMGKSKPTHGHRGLPWRPP